MKCSALRDAYMDLGDTLNDLPEDPKEKKTGTFYFVCSA